MQNLETFSEDLVLDPNEIAGFQVLQINKGEGTARWQVQAITKGGAILPVSKGFREQRDARSQMHELKNKGAPQKALSTQHEDEAEK